MIILCGTCVYKPTMSLVPTMSSSMLKIVISQVWNNACRSQVCPYTCRMTQRVTNFEMLRRRLHRRAGLIEQVPTNGAKMLKELYESEWSKQFEQLMRNRLVMGALRYGKLHAKGKPKYDRVQSILKRMRLYSETGNKELLVDVANLCLLEFEEGNHPKAHFASVDDTKEHVAPAA